MKSALLVVLLAASPARAGLEGAAHHGTPDSTGVAWLTELHLDGTEPIPIAVDLPIRDVQRIEGARPDTRDGRVRALLPTRPIVVLHSHQDGLGSLRPPLVLDPEALQQVTVEDLRFTPSAEAEIERRVGWSASPSVDASERRELVRMLDRDARHRKVGSTVLRVDHALGAGLEGVLEPGGRQRLPVVLGAFAVGLGLILGLGATYRGLEHVARRERLDRWLAEAGGSEPS